MIRSKLKLNVLFAGNNGRNKTGSEAKLKTTIDDVRAVLGDRLGTVTVLTHSAKNQRRYLQDPSIRLIELNRLHFADPRIWAIHPDVVFLCGDYTWDDHFSPINIWTFATVVRMAKRLGTCVVAYANDYRVTGAVNQRLLKVALESVDLVLFNNTDAVQRVKGTGVSNEVFCTADSTFLLPPPDPSRTEDLIRDLRLDPRQHRIVSIAPTDFFAPRERGFLATGVVSGGGLLHPSSRRMERRENRERYIRQMAVTCDWLTGRHDAYLALIAFNPEDEAVTRRIHERMSARHRARLITSRDATVVDVQAILSVSRLLITCQYYPAVMASAFAIPTVGISADSRLEQMFQELGRMDMCIDYIDTPSILPNTFKLDELLQQRITEVVARESQWRESMSELHQSYRRRALLNREHLERWGDRLFGKATESLHPVQMA